jgi:hypothetical protein
MLLGQNDERWLLQDTAWVSQMSLAGTAIQGSSLVASLQSNPLMRHACLSR